MPYMAPADPGDFVLEERCALPDGAWLELRLARGPAGLVYRLAYRREGDCLLAYESDARRGPLRILRGRTSPYAFRSIEQLRYDFERELEAL